MRPPTQRIAFTLNGRAVEIHAEPMRRLSDVLRDELALKGTKVGCDAGDCGACTVRLDGRQVCSCLVAIAQVDGREVTTVEGLARGGRLSALQESFFVHGAAQCGICTPGMLMAADDLIARQPDPSEAEVMDALGGVLCRCTGYRKIIDAVLGYASAARAATPPVGAAVGARMPKVDGLAKLIGTERYGADDQPAGALALRAIRSPYASAQFTIGDLAPLHARHPGLRRVLTARDVPGQNRFGIYPTGKDQPVFAEGMVRFRGEAIAALVGEPAAIAAIGDDEFPIAWEFVPALFGIDAATAPGARAIHETLPDNVLVRGRVARGDPELALRHSAAIVAARYETSFVEHAYIEPEAGWARRVGDRLEIFVTTQSPYMDRDEIALVMGIAPHQVRIVPSAVGGGFGGKLDLSLQPLVAIAAWHLNQPVRSVYTRPESMASTTKRHPARIQAVFAADRDGRLASVVFHGDFNTGAYASWGPTVANRVPVHATGPYEVRNLRCTTRAIHTNDPPAGAFRGFGVPQAAIAHEGMMDELAEKLDIDPLEFRHRNALKRGSITATGQKLHASTGLQACLDALRPRWQRLRAQAREFNAANAGQRRGVGVACMWYGLGNTSMSNPSEIEIGLASDGTITMFCGAVDIGQGSTTILVQIAADALGVPAAAIRIVVGDTDRTRDAGKTSASRQTLVSGHAAKVAAEDLRRQILRLGNVGEDASIRLDGGHIVLRGPTGERVVDLAARPDVSKECILIGYGRFDPPTTPLDVNGQGVPYASYGYGAQLAEVEVDPALGTTRVLRVVAAHDVGRAVNPTQVEGQIHGGVAQGIGLALMEEYLPGVTENLHDYLIPTIGDVPPIETILIEDPEPIGPYGAKGVGEPALIATAPAILNAIFHATGVRIRRLPATPDRVRAAILARGL
jgi:CO/xanthine dehydrogenase Mo-binding subunit/aerobic-type carbon monoxide dehydrogenase small subunit (CoxS/CutS family)